ncbi:hypothetical protein BDV06DRAFT_205554 [Aspergillus oleicola]
MEAFNGSTFSYSSLIDPVLQRIPADREADFPVESSYFDLQCQLIAIDVDSSEAYMEWEGH